MKKKPTESQHVIFRFPKDWVAAFRKAARSKKQSLSAWVRDACASQLDDASRAKLSKPRGSGRYPKPDDQ